MKGARMDLARKPANRRIPCLDGLRACAICLVLWLHASCAGYGQVPSWFPYSGRLGVSLFFVLSGYLITTLLLRERESLGRVDLKSFYVRRALRIFPPFYAFLAFIWIASHFGLPVENWSSVLVAACYGLNFRNGENDHNIRHAWSLSIEEQYYVFWPLFFILLKPTRALAVAVGMSLGWSFLRVIKLGSAVTASEMLQATSFDTLLMGSALGLLGWIRPGFGAGLRHRLSAVVLPLAALISLFSFHSLVPNGFACLIPLGRDLLINWLVWWCIHNPDQLIGRILQSAPLVYVGEISYSLYIWHMPFLRPTALGPGLVMRGLPSFLAILVAANLSYWLLERPLRRLRSQWRPVTLEGSA